MRVLIVNRFFGEPAAPTGRMAHGVAAALVERGHEVHVLTGSGDYARRQDDDARAWPGVTVTRLFATNGARLMSWIAFWCQSLVRIPLMRWDRCVLLTDPPFLVAAAPLARCAGAQRAVYWWTMDLYPEALVADGIATENGLTDRTLRWLNEFGLKSVDGVIALGGRQVQRLRAYRNWNHTSEFHVIAPPWDDRAIQAVPAAANRVLRRHDWAGKKVALYAGNLGRGHSYGALVEAARRMHERGDEKWVFAFFCRGWGRDRLVRAAADLPNVVVSDYVAQDETADLLHAADVHLITMEDGWEGIVVPTKLSGVLRTTAPVLFLGPPDADTAEEIRRLDAGLVLPNQSGPAELTQALDTLAARPRVDRPTPEPESERIARFVTRPIAAAKTARSTASPAA